MEVQRADSPRLTPSIRIALQDLGLECVVAIYPGSRRYPIADRVEAVALDTLARSEQFPEREMVTAGCIFAALHLQDAAQPEV